MNLLYEAIAMVTAVQPPMNDHWRYQLHHLCMFVGYLCQCSICIIALGILTARSTACSCTLCCRYQQRQHPILISLSHMMILWKCTIQRKVIDKVTSYVKGDWGTTTVWKSRQLK